MKATISLVIRCATPDCVWGFLMPDLDEAAFDACYSAFRKHCEEVHGLTPDTATHSAVHLDLIHWTLELWD